MVALLDAGDVHEAAAELIRLDAGRIRAYLRRLLRDADDADEAFSIFAEWTLRGIRHFQRRGPVEAWALGVARNAARKVRGDRRRLAPLGEASFARLALEREAPRADDLEVAAMRLDAVRAALPASDRELLGLRLEGRLRWNDIASRMASRGAPVTPTALRKRFERLKGRMGRMVREAEPPS